MTAVGLEANPVSKETTYETLVLASQREMSWPGRPAFYSCPPVSKTMG